MQGTSCFYLRALVFITFILLHYSTFSQGKPARFKGKTSFKIVLVNDSILKIEGGMIKLEVEENWLDTCDYGRNSRTANFTLVNKTKLPVTTIAEVYYWYDGGLYTDRTGKRITIPPGGKVEVPIHVMSWHKRKVTSGNSFLIADGQHPSDAYLQLRFNYTEARCDNKAVPIDSPAPSSR